MAQLIENARTPSGIPCYIAEEDGQWGVGNDDYLLHGSGDSQDEATADFERAIREWVAEQREALDRLALVADAAARLADHPSAQPRPGVGQAQRCLFCGRGREGVEAIFESDNGASICEHCVKAAHAEIPVG